MSYTLPARCLMYTNVLELSACAYDNLSICQNNYRYKIFVRPTRVSISRPGADDKPRQPSTTAGEG